MGQKTSDYYVEKKLYTFADGLSGRAVRQVAQDSKGFMWFITNNGLCRFDGKEFKVFTQKLHGLYNNNISSIVSDKGQGIIINYFSDRSKYTVSHEHIEVMDINTLKVKKLKEHYKTIPFGESDVSEIRPDPDENNVLCFLKPFFNLHIETFPEAKIWRLDAHNNFARKKIEPIKVINFKWEGKNLAANIMPYSFASPISGHSVFIFKDSSVMCPPDNGARLIYKDNVGGYVFRYSDSIGTKYFYFSDYNFIKEIKENDTRYPSFIWDKNIHYFTVRMDYTGVLFSQNNSLHLYRNKNELITLIDSTDNEKIKKAQIVSVFRDNIGNYWVSTSEGVLKLTIKKKKFQHLFTYHQIPSELNNSTRGFYKYKDALLVASYDFIGVQKKNSTEIIKAHYNFNFCEKDNTLWLAAGDLGILDLVSKKIEIKSPPLLGEYWTIFPLSNNQLLVGCSSTTGIYDIEKNNLRAIDTSKFRQPKITYKIFEYEGNIVVVASNGIYILNKQGKIIDCYSKDQKDATKCLLVEEINDVHIDKDGLYWICTAFDGLYCWNRKDNKLEQFGIEHGFLSMTHYRIEEDEFNNLWISTDFGLAKFNKKIKRAKIYTETDGVSHNEFNRVSSFKDKDGTLYFGGMNGVTYFHPKDFFTEERVQDYSFVVNKLSLYNSATNLMEDQTGLYYSNQQIVLEGNTKNVSIEVALLDLEDRIHTYAYQIEGLDKEWNYIKEGTIKLNNLPYGTHSLKIKAQCLNGLWNKTEINIPILVPIPFYKTRWFIAMIVMCLFALIFVTIKQRTKILLKQNEKLEQTVETRTVELKESLAEQIALLQEVHHRVKNNLQFIAAMLKMQLNTIKDESNQQILKETSRRINAMSLVHEMLYNKEKVEYVSLKEYVSELVVKLKEMVYDIDEPIEFKLEIDDVKFNINNCVAIGMITSEIISNAIKYAFTGTKNPTISIKLEYIKNGNKIIYTVKDNGSGLVSENKKIGLGLRLIDIFSRQMEAEYQTINDNGVAYIFKIPYTINEK